MIDPTTRAAIRAAIRCNEIGNASPYCLSFAGKGNSGGSFGVFQGDLHANREAVSPYLKMALGESGVNAPTVSRIVSELSQVCLESPLSCGDTTLVDAALRSDAGKKLVDQMDDVLEKSVIRDVEVCLESARNRTMTIEPMAVLYIACWSNMTGLPAQLARWIGGATVRALPPPSGPSVTGPDLQRYLGKCEYFLKNPHHMLHLHESVAQGMKSLT
jgi:hypothetical protein